MFRDFPILNYPGSKRKLMKFIDTHISQNIPKNKAIFDLFAGSGSVSYFYKDKYQVYSNDSELYSSIILDALMKFSPTLSFEVLKREIDSYIIENKNKLTDIYGELIREEIQLFNKGSLDIKQLYFSFPNFWKLDNQSGDTDTILNNMRNNNYYSLFTNYYSGTYFGIKQCSEIDSIRYAIEKINIDNTTKSMLLTSLFYAMKESVFSKDGHMAQYLNIEKNFEKLLKRRSVSIYSKFFQKVNEFYSPIFCKSNKNNEVFNLTIDELLYDEKNEIFENVGFIYADPPYTDMQYSRYFHLLNTVVTYQYPEMSLYRGNISKGLYTVNRFQSPLSQKSKALNYHKELFDFCYINKMGLAFSFAYPADPQHQPTNRYVLDINDLIEYGENLFGSKFYYVTQDYQHSNNRNSSSKKVLEYLLIYTP